MQKINVDNLINKLIEHMTQYCVGIGTGPSGNASDPPIGSGTLCTISSKDHTYYIILTAAHVSYELLSKKETGGLLKDAKGNEFFFITLPTHTILLNFILIDMYCSTKELKNQFNILDSNYPPDIAFIVIAKDNLPALLSRLQWYNLTSTQDHNIKAELQEALLSGFFRSASPDVQGNLLKETGPYLGGGESLKYNTKHKMQFWRIPNKSKLPKGASGASFWRVVLTEGTPKVSLGGIITSSTPKKEIIANAASKIYKQLYSLKHW